MGSFDQIMRRVDDLQSQVKALSGGPQLAHSSIEGGALESYDSDGELRLVIGQQEDGTQTVASVNGPTPPAPSAPSVVVDGPVLTVTWDGLTRNGEVLPADFRRVLVFVSDLDGLFPAAAAASIEPVAGASTVTSVTETGTYQVALVMESESGKVSAFSVSVPAVVKLVGLSGALDAVVASANGKNKVTYAPTDPPTDYVGAVGDTWFRTSDEGIVGQWVWSGAEWLPQLLSHQVLASIDLGRATVGELDGVRIKAESIGTGQLKANAVTASILSGDAVNGKTVTGATVQTNVDGARVALDPQGIHAWNAAGVQTFDVKRDTGEVTQVGNFYSNVTGQRRTIISDKISIPISPRTISGDQIDMGPGVIFDTNGGSKTSGAIFQSRRPGLQIINGQASTVWSPTLSMIGPTSSTSNGAAVGALDLDDGSAVLSQYTLSQISGDVGGPLAWQRNSAYVRVSDKAGLYSSGASVEVNSAGNTLTKGVAAYFESTNAGMGRNTYSGTNADWAWRWYRGDEWFGEMGSPGGTSNANDFGIATQNRSFSLVVPSTGGHGHILVNHLTSTAAANVSMDAKGVVRRNTSVRSSKLNERDMAREIPDLTSKLLSVRPKMWHDREAVEAYVRHLDGEDGIIPEQVFNRIPGLVAEDVEAAGLGQFCFYDEDGNLDGLMYDRISVATLVALQEQDVRITSLESEVAALADRITTLEGVTP